MTFSQLLVKAHRNEEEEITSKVVNKNVTVGNNPTLEQRVDSLIAKLNRNQASPNSPNRDNSWDYGQPPFQSNQRSRGDYRSPLGHPQGDIRQNLRGPETSAAGPVGKLMARDLFNALGAEGGATPKDSVRHG